MKITAIQRDVSVAQMVEHPAFNRVGVGSSPTRHTIHAGVIELA